MKASDALTELVQQLADELGVSITYSPGYGLVFDPPLWHSVQLESLGELAERFGRYRTSKDAYGRARDLLAGDAKAEARLLSKEGTVLDREGAYDPAIERFERGLAALSDADDLAVRADLELGYGRAKLRQGKFDEAREWAERATAHAEEAGHRRAIAHGSYLQWAASYAARGASETEKLHDALAIFEEIGDDVGQGWVLNNLGVEAYYQGRWDEALELWGRSREAQRRAGDVANVVVQALNEGEILSDQGNIARAEELFREALRVHGDAGFAAGAAFATSNLARAAARDGRFAEARRLFDEALVQFGEIGAENELVETQVRIAECLVLAGEHGRALEQANSAKARAEESGASKLLTPLLERVIGYALVQRGTPEEARAHFERSLEIARELGTAFEIGLTLTAMADTGIGPNGDELRAESEAILERLGVVRVPRVPLP